MKMKIKTIADSFGPLSTVYDSIEGVKRKWDLLPGYKELKEAAGMYDEEREKLLAKHTVQSPQGPMLNNVTFYQDHSKLLNTEIEIKKPLKFTKEEVDASKIKNSDLVRILDFIY